MRTITIEVETPSGDLGLAFTELSTLLERNTGHFEEVTYMRLVSDDNQFRWTIIDGPRP